MPIKTQISLSWSALKCSKQIHFQTVSDGFHAGE